MMDAFSFSINLAIADCSFVGSNNSIALSPILKKATLTFSEGTISTPLNSSPSVSR